MLLLVQDIERLNRILLPTLRHLEQVADRPLTAAALQTSLQQLIGHARDSIGKT